MTFQTLDLPRHTIEPARQRGLQPVGAVGRQMRGKSGFHHQCLRHSLAGRIVGELAGKIRRQAEGVLGAHVFCSEPHIVVRV